MIVQCTAFVGLKYLYNFFGQTDAMNASQVTCLVPAESRRPCDSGCRGRSDVASVARTDAALGWKSGRLWWSSVTREPL